MITLKHTHQPQNSQTTKEVYGYIRVSTAKQGKGVSLIAQQEAIKNFALKHQLKIIEWFEEKETAAKQGRPVFNKMLKLLRKGKASGVIIHKIDRSARNLKDWSMINELPKENIMVYFAHENIDLTTREGQLSADLQAVIAADYVRNLRQETIKGLYGRLKQGIYPFKAPIGYLDTGSGNPKKIAPKKGTLVKYLFEQYATGKYTQVDITNEARRIGLTNSGGKTLSKNNVAAILTNPFYTGLMRVKGKLYKGLHQPIITMDTFQTVQDVIHGKKNNKVVKHNFLFRKLLKCNSCQHLLSGEKQKGKVYYRCHTKGCITKGVRGDYIEKRIEEILEYLEFREEEAKSFEEILNNEIETTHQDCLNIQNTIRIKNAEIENKLEKLDETFIYSVLSEEVYLKQKNKLLTEKQRLDDKIDEFNVKKEVVQGKLTQFFELLKSLKLSYHLANTTEKRKLLEYTTSNLLIEGKKLFISMQTPFNELYNMLNPSKCCLTPTHLRTCRCEIARTTILGIDYLIIDLETEIPKRQLLNREQLYQISQSVLFTSLGTSTSYAL